MESTIGYFDIPSRANSFIDEMNEVINKNSDWWNDADGKTEASLGDAVYDALDKAKKLSLENPIQNLEKTKYKNINSFATSLKKIISVGKALNDTYKKAKRVRDVNILRTFTDIADSNLNYLDSTISDLDENSNENPSQFQDAAAYLPESFYILLINSEQMESSSASVEDYDSLLNLALDFDLTKLANVGNLSGNEKILVAVKNTQNVITVPFSLKITRDPKIHVLNLSLDKKFNYPIQDSILKDLTKEWTGDGIFNEELFLVKTINKNTFVQICENGSTRYNTASLSQLISDNNTDELSDALEFTGDISAMASIIAYRKMEPPLAIGLFGNWGSGKSFFMNRLQTDIENLSQLSGNTYCHDIVHVNFNSWNYSDSNLWASLVTKIFESLKAYSEGRNTMDELFKNLASTKDLINESNKKLEIIKDKKSDLEKTLIAKQKEINSEVVKLQSIKTKDLLEEAWRSVYIQDELDQVKKLLPNKTLNNLHAVHGQINELSNFPNQVKEGAKITWKLAKGKKIWVLIPGMLVLGICYLITSNYNKPAGEFFNWFAIKFSAALAIMVNLFTLLAGGLGKAKAALKGLQSLDNAVKTQEEKERVLQNIKLDTLYAAIEINKQDLNRQQEELKSLELSRTTVENEIHDIATGRKLSNFIESKVSDQRYMNSLGIISWIRKDFEDLDFLLNSQHEMSPEKMKKLGREKVENVLKIERIILYIDDLDRCNEDIVVKVLEAINLLLALPLFVVVVGVDPRWVNNALNLKFNYQLKSKNNESRADKTDPEYTKPATSYDYLEKIFQIPFALKSINKTGKDKLILDQLKKTDSATKTTPDQDKGERKDDRSKDELRGDNYQSGVNETNSQGSSANPALLEIGEEEMKFMQEISFLIGDSPRTIKRYINIYRIIRSHSRFVFSDDMVMVHYMAALVLLGIITGLPEISQDFFASVKASADGELFENLVRSESDKHLTESFEYEQLKLTLEIKVNKIKLGSIPVDKFKKNIGLISRFSYRSFALV